MKEDIEGGVSTITTFDWLVSTTYGEALAIRDFYAGCTWTPHSTKFHMYREV